MSFGIWVYKCHRNLKSGLRVRQANLRHRIDLAAPKCRLSKTDAQPRHSPGWGCRSKQPRAGSQKLEVGTTGRTHSALHIDYKPSLTALLWTGSFSLAPLRCARACGARKGEFVDILFTALKGRSSTLFFVVFA
jgi:hypothetical protein